MPEFSHFNDQGRARMVDVTGKAATFRRAAAAGDIRRKSCSRRERPSLQLRGRDRNLAPLRKA